MPICRLKVILLISEFTFMILTTLVLSLHKNLKTCRDTAPLRGTGRWDQRNILWIWQYGASQM